MSVGSLRRIGLGGGRGLPFCEVMSLCGLLVDLASPNAGTWRVDPRRAARTLSRSPRLFSASLLFCRSPQMAPSFRRRAPAHYGSYMRLSCRTHPADVSGRGWPSGRPLVSGGDRPDLSSARLAVLNRRRPDPRRPFLVWTCLHLSSPRDAAGATRRSASTRPAVMIARNASSRSVKGA
jgi:hypothetical protein